MGEYISQDIFSQLFAMENLLLCLNQANSLMTGSPEVGLSQPCNNVMNLNPKPKRNPFLDVRKPLAASPHFSLARIVSHAHF